MLKKIENEREAIFSDKFLQSLEWENFTENLLKGSVINCHWRGGGEGCSALDFALKVPPIMKTKVGQIVSVNHKDKPSCRHV